MLLSSRSGADLTEAVRDASAESVRDEPVTTGPEASTPALPDAEPGLRQLVVRGGKYLVLRQGAAVVIGLFGVLLLTRLLGPARYGVYAGALAVVLFSAQVGRLGLEVFLVRREEAPSPAVYSQAFTLLLCSGFSLVGLSLLSLPLLREWTLAEGSLQPVRVLFLVLPLMLIQQPAFAALERRMDFRAIALIELSGQLGFYAVALPLALLGLGVWAPVIGFFVWQTCLLVGAYGASGLRPRLRWSPPLVREILTYGLSFSASTWIWELRVLVNPLLVGHYLGAASVAHVSLAMRFVDVLSVVRYATYRLSIAALARVQDDVARLRRIVEESMTLQILGVAPLLGLGSSMLFVLPSVLGERWAPLVEVFPYIALASIANAVFNMHSSVLYVRKQNRQVGLFHLVHIVLFAAAGLLFIPRLGLVGYGVAELVACLSYAVLHSQLRRLFSVSYRAVLPWLLALAPACFAALVPWPWTPLLAVPVVVLLSMRGPRNLLTRYGRQTLARGQSHGAPP